MDDNTAKVGSIMHMVHASAFAVDFPDFVLKSSSVKVVLSTTSDISAHPNGLTGQSDTVHCIGMSIRAHASQADTVATPHDGI